MNIEMNASLFFYIFILLPFLFILFVFIDFSVNKEKDINLKLHNTVAEFFDNFEDKKISLSQTDLEEYQSLKAMQLKYNSYTKNIFLKLFIIWQLVNILFGKNISESNKRQIKMHKELEVLKDEFFCLILVGIFVHNNNILKFYLFVNKINIESVEIDMFSKKNPSNYCIREGVYKIDFSKIMRIA